MRKKPMKSMASDPPGREAVAPGDVLAAALAAVARGWSVIPVRPRDKRPLIAWQTYQESRADAAQVRAWYAKSPQANLGIVTGAVSGLVVLDIDPKHGGAASLGELEQRHGPLPRTAPVVFNGDTASINKLIENAPKLTYSGESPTDHRERRNVLRDQLDDGHDGLTESEEGSSELSLMAQIVMLFKTTEILGQVLKNQYAKIQRTRKSDLITELFNGPLRALRDCFEFFEKNPDALVAGIEAAIEREGNVEKEERTKIARKFVGSLIQLITFSFLMRAAQGASSDSLLEDVQDVVKRNGTTAFRMIELCILLDSPKALPKQKLVELYEEVKKDVVGFRLLQIMVLNRLYMFKTVEKDMQWLSQKLDLGIGIQHAISYQQSQRRRLK